MKLFGEKLSREGIAEAVRKYGHKCTWGTHWSYFNFNLSVLSFGKVCNGEDSGVLQRLSQRQRKAFCSRVKRSIADRSPSQTTVPPSVLSDLKRRDLESKSSKTLEFACFKQHYQSLWMQMTTLWIPRYCKIDSSQSKGTYTNQCWASGEIPRYAEELNPIYLWNFIIDTVHNRFKARLHVKKRSNGSVRKKHRFQMRSPVYTYKFCNVPKRKRQGSWKSLGTGTRPFTRCLLRDR